MYCRNCGKELEDNVFICPQCGCDIREDETETNEANDTLGESAEENVLKEVSYSEVHSAPEVKSEISCKGLSTKVFVIFASVICFFMAALTAIGCITIVYKPSYEYKVVKYYPEESEERAGDNLESTAAFTTIDVDEKELNVLGGENWEIVTSYLETETAWPNFGNSEYVTGLQPNIRPQALVIILRREKPFTLKQ